MVNEQACAFFRVPIFVRECLHIVTIAFRRLVRTKLNALYIKRLEQNRANGENQARTFSITLRGDAPCDNYTRSQGRDGERGRTCVVLPCSFLGYPMGQEKQKTRISRTT